MNSHIESENRSRPTGKPFNPPSLATSVVWAAALLATSAAQAANSARIYWDVNGHYYQRFETGGITWTDAKKNCETVSAHLATITSQQEQDFIQTSLLPYSNTRLYYHLGATDVASQLNYKWVTGEAWGYEHWYSGQPDNRNAEDYLAIASYYSGSSTHGGWYDVYGSDLLTGYMCEWSTQNYIATASVPDLNGNGVDEIAGLFVDYKTGIHTVQIKDPSNDAILSTLTFTRSLTPPSGLVVLKDINNNGVPEVGVLFVRQGLPNVQVKDAKNNGAVVRSINFLSGLFTPKAVNSFRAGTSGAADRIVVMGIRKGTGKAVSEVRDSNTGAKLNDTPF